MPHPFAGLGPCNSVFIPAASPDPSALSLMLEVALARLDRAVNDASNLLYLAQTDPGIYLEYLRRIGKIR